MDDGTRLIGNGLVLGNGLMVMREHWYVFNME